MFVKYKLMVSLIGSSDAYTSWSPTQKHITPPTYNSGGGYIAPAAPPVITHPTTNETTTLDHEFIDNIVRKNQQNIYESSSTLNHFVGLSKFNELEYLDGTNGFINLKTKFTATDENVAEINQLLTDIGNHTTSNSGNTTFSFNTNFVNIATGYFTHLYYLDGVSLTNVKFEISDIKTEISDIKTNHTSLTNSITEINNFLELPDNIDGKFLRADGNWIELDVGGLEGDIETLTNNLNTAVSSITDIEYNLTHIERISSTSGTFDEIPIYPAKPVFRTELTDYSVYIGHRTMSQDEPGYTGATGEQGTTQGATAVNGCYIEKLRFLVNHYQGDRKPIWKDIRDLFDDLTGEFNYYSKSEVDNLLTNVNITLSDGNNATINAILEGYDIYFDDIYRRLNIENTANTTSQDDWNPLDSTLSMYGSVLKAGASFFKAFSPKPLCYVNSDGFIDSTQLYDPIFQEQVYGVSDSAKSFPFLHGLVPSFPVDVWTNIQYTGWAGTATSAETITPQLFWSAPNSSSSNWRSHHDRTGSLTRYSGDDTTHENLWIWSFRDGAKYKMVGFTLDYRDQTGQTYSRILSGGDASRYIDITNEGGVDRVINRDDPLHYTIISGFWDNSIPRNSAQGLDYRTETGVEFGYNGAVPDLEYNRYTLNGKGEWTTVVQDHIEQVNDYITNSLEPIVSGQGNAITTLFDLKNQLETTGVHLPDGSTTQVRWTLQQELYGLVHNHHAVNIASNTGNISTNTTNITTNTDNIATNTTDIASLQNKTQDFTRSSFMGSSSLTINTDVITVNNDLRADKLLYKNHTTGFYHSIEVDLDHLTSTIDARVPITDGNSGKWLSSDNTFKEINIPDFDTTTIDNNIATLQSTTTSLQSQINAIPDYPEIPELPSVSQSSKFVITSLAGSGHGSYTYITPSTDLINEGNNLYYTETRVNNAINNKIADGSISNAVIGQVSAQTLTALSDINLKENIKKITNNSVLKDLEPVEYNFKDNKRKRYGLIAQDVEEIYPELIHENKEGTKSINYQDIIALLIKDNQDLRMCISNLAHRIGNLEK